ncbi:hypothetical protein K420107F6_40350 [Lactonifactor longoviformis]
MDGMGQGSIYLYMVQVVFGELVSDERSQAVSCDSVASDTEKNDFVPGYGMGPHTV